MSSSTHGCATGPTSASLPSPTHPREEKLMYKKITRNEEAPQQSFLRLGRMENGSAARSRKQRVCFSLLFCKWHCGSLNMRGCFRRSLFCRIVAAQPRTLPARTTVTSPGVAIGIQRHINVHVLFMWKIPLYFSTGALVDASVSSWVPHARKRCFCR